MDIAPVIPRTPVTAFVARRRVLQTRLEMPALIVSGLPRSRNYRANWYPFRSSSHFLYFIGTSIPAASLAFDHNGCTLYVDLPDPADAWWHGPRPSLAELARRHGLDGVRPLGEIDGALRDNRSRLATLPPEDASTA